MTTERDELTTQEFIKRLLRPERAQWLDTFEVLAFTEIGDWDRVADIGCGPGYFTIPLAKALINGKLYALDINEEMVEACRERVAQARLGNVEVLKCDEFDFPIEKGSLNGLFLAFVIQQSPDKPRFLRAVRELLRPRGWCSILEWYHMETETGPPVERRVDPGDMREMATGAGFRYVAWRDINGEQYMMTLRNQ
jgi:ubiquinone/menaquinone biosynthesis C-methylase UbiE